MDTLPAREGEAYEKAKNYGGRKNRTGTGNLREQVVHREWGEFEPAIRRWEAVTGNDAPEPTLPDGQKGQHRLNSRFTEWMMGLAPGWITGHGLSRKDEIKMAGNGVVPQQAVFALSMLLERLEK
jgi:DNA (cytosine-5)-methyltransferase 1